MTSPGQYLKPLLAALIVSAAAALLCLAGFLLFFSPIREQRPDADPFALQGENLEVDAFGYRLVRGVPGDSPAAIAGLAPDALVVMLPQGIDADRFVFFDYRLAGRNPNLKISLLWRQASEPAELRALELPWTGDAGFNLFLAKDPNWRGPIHSLALQATGDLEGQQLRIERLQFSSYSIPGLLRAIGDEWLAFRRWDMGSINFMIGAAPRPILLPIAILGPSALLALLLYGIGSVRGGAPNPVGHRTALLGILLLHWLVGDLLWGRTQWLQFDRSLHEYAGKAPQEKAINSADRKISAFVAELKAHHLAAAPSRIFIVHDSDGHNFARLVTQFHLAPHNVYNFGKLPPNQGIAGGDYILALQKIPDMSYDAESRRLTWNRGPGVDAVKLYDSPVGTLYRVAEPAAKPCGFPAGMVHAAKGGAGYRCKSATPLSIQDWTLSDGEKAALEAPSTTLEPPVRIEQGSSLSISSE